MNREIKFRAWDKYNKIMLQNESLVIYLEKCFVEKPSFHRDTILVDLSFNPEFIMQFTGRQDKNGKDIYEGDIVTHAMNPNKFVIIYDSTRCRFRLKDFEFYIEDEYFAVVGNIYENPELLEKK